MEEGRGSFKILAGKPTVNKLLGRSKHRWEDIIRIDLKKRDANTRNWTGSAQDMD